MKIYFNGIEQNLNDFDGTQSISFTFRNKDESGESGFSFSPELTVTGSAFSFLYTELIDRPNPNLESVDVLVFDDCCRNPDGSDRLIFTGKINGSDVRWCEEPNCEMTVTIIDDTSDAVALACLKNIFPWDRKPKFDGSGDSGGEDTFRISPHVPYCVDVRPNFLQELILIFGFIGIFIVAPIAITVGLLITIVNFLIFFLSLGQYGPISELNYLDDAVQFIDRLTEIIVGCGRKHKTPYIHSYIRNMCDICGLNLQSSLFEPGGTYHNSVRMDAAFKTGRRNDLQVRRAFEFNKPNLNGVQFLDSFKQFNIDWKVVNGILYVERKDFEFGGLWFDASTFTESEIISLCFEPIDEQPAAFAEYRYAKDGIDNTGDETNPDWVERAIDWNVPVNPAQRGLFSRVFSFSTAQFRNDSGRDEKSSLDKDVYKTFFPILNQFDDAMLLERGICGFPRLLQLADDTDSDPLNAKVKKYNRNSAEPLFDFNVDWWVKESYQDETGTNYDTLYQRLLQIDDPRNTTIKTRRFEIVIQSDCDLIRGITLEGFVRIPQGGNVFDGTIENVDFNTTNNQITVTGKI